ncbi:bile acid:sodium symporter family protein [Hymenobacter sp. GOD-10R]|uniref:bile acid:sodium symporter family protein n=1 Tax=Hymenobacter sp. GOD-10R TaxID=3093922 RepID=UPI002D79ADB1|nr:bile acid:sodium symporter family protein [Hymenobacter sp. GOD-10R]WRQ30546.1 bile acid:sodium symporter family protein [Hymenobacter sp. GOD-10R]
MPTTNPPATPPQLVPATRSSGLLARIGLDPFLLALAGVVGLAYLAPSIGSDESPIPWHQITTIGVGLIFFFYGLRLSMEKLRVGMRNWRLHVLVQLTTFVLFPLLALAARPLFAHEENATLWSSIFFLTTLPSTVSTSVVMVSIAGGNIPAAIFNASISSLIGIVATPLLTSLVLNTNTEGANLGGLVTDLLLQVVLPVVAGVLLNARLGAFAAKHSNALRLSDQFVILLIVYTAFCESFARHVFQGYSALGIVALSAGMAGLFFLVYGIVTLISRLLGFSEEDRITAVFCGSKKSLVHGTVMANLLFPGTAATGALLLPLMLYHAIQILIASIIARAQGRQNEQAAAVASAPPRSA